MNWFARLARTLPWGVGRRQALTLVGSTLAAALLACGSAEAGCKKVGRKCDKNTDCCDGAKCKKGKCTCKNRFTKCHKKCYDLDKDENHCGGCDNSCAATETCCSGACVNIQQNNAHCGACNAPCPDLINDACIGGACIPR